jgi:hypothetical protein
MLQLLTLLRKIPRIRSSPDAPPLPHLAATARVNGPGVNGGGVTSVLGGVNSFSGGVNTAAIGVNTAAGGVNGASGRVGGARPAGGAALAALAAGKGLGIGGGPGAARGSDTGGGLRRARPAGARGALAFDRVYFGYDKSRGNLLNVSFQVRACPPFGISTFPGHSPRFSLPSVFFPNLPPLGILHPFLYSCFLP